MMDLTGVKFGRLTVLGEAERHVFPNGKTERRLECQCDCGEKHETLLMHLRNGRTKSCGCLHREAAAKHGMKDTPTYRAWANMVRRATGKVMQKNYADRGIGVCKRWLDFKNFLEDMGERPDGLTLERKDNSKGYSPENCKWASQAEQSRNTRRTRRIAFRGETLCLSDMADKYGIGAATLRTRLRLGWTVRKAITTPVKETARWPQSP